MPIEIPSVSAQLYQEIQDGVQTISQLRQKLTEAQTRDVTHMVTVLLLSTIALGASDIHLEPEITDIKLRLRIDGMLQDAGTIDRTIYTSLLSRIKLLAGAKLNIADKPQDGRFSFQIPNGGLIESRVATLPTEYGESAVIRVLNPKNLIKFSELDLRKDLQEMLVRELKKPNGLIVATGPTGSGKTSTLYALLNEIIHPEIKVITIEDPIEYHLPGAIQTQVHPERGYDFASGLQAIVRQDPDVILVGEIRDDQTAQIALQAALTGHLVFSTLHTNNAPGTISRLLSLGSLPINIAAATNLIIGQRLVRRVCAQCAVYDKTAAEEIAAVETSVKGLPARIQPQGNARVAKAKGCSVCNTTGYKGRVGLFEAIVVDGPMEEFILTNPSISLNIPSTSVFGTATNIAVGFPSTNSATSTVKRSANRG